MARFLVNPITPLVLFSLGLAALLSAYAVRGVPMGELATWLLDSGWSLMVVLWMDLDARLRRRVPCFDFGFLSLLFFPLSLAWYCIWSRGWGPGLLLLLLMFALWFVPRLLAIYVQILLLMAG